MYTVYDCPDTERHGLINYKDTKTKCLLYWCLKESIDWILIINERPIYNILYTVYTVYDCLETERHGLINYKDTNSKCRLY